MHFDSCLEQRSLYKEGEMQNDISLDVMRTLDCNVHVDDYKK